MKDQNSSVEGFLLGKPPRLAALALKTLEKRYRFEGGVVCSAQVRVRSLLEVGTLEISTLEEPRIKPMRVRQFNRATVVAQDVHNERMKNGGILVTYLVNGSELGKASYDYAKFLLSK